MTLRVLATSSHGSYHEVMKAVGTKQLKNELSRYLQLVRAGETILVLDREDVVAEIRPPSSPSLRRQDAWDATLAELEAQGSVRKASNPTGTLDHLVGRRPPVADLRACLDEVRGDRF
ncbi:MAG: type II toxin-antitoxin system Phd/YefM family antitoxin [Myxococcota bacterium]